MVFSIFTRLCNHHDYLFQNILITLKRNCPLAVTFHSTDSRISPSSWQLLSVYRSVYSGHFTGIIQYVAFCVWLLSFNIMCLRFIHGTSFFFLIAEWCSLIWICHILFIYSSVAHLSCFHFPALMNKAAMNIRHTSFYVDICSLGCIYLGVGLLGHT